MSDLEFFQEVDRPVTITGVARNASAGAVVIRETAEISPPVYVADLHEWGAEIGRTVSVSGVLRRRAIVPIAKITEQVLHTHGLHDAVFVIDNPTWTIH